MSDKMRDEGLLTVPEFIAKSRISRSTFYVLLRKKAGPKITKIGGRTLIDSKDGDEWLKSRQFGAVSDTAPYSVPSAANDTAVVSQACAVMRLMSFQKHMLIVLSVGDGGLTIEEVARRAGLNRSVVRTALPALREIITIRHDDAGQETLHFTSARIVCMVETLRHYCEGLSVQIVTGTIQPDSGIT